MYPVIFLSVIIIASLLKIFLTGSDVVETFLLFILVIGIGCTGIFAFIGHMFRSDSVAKNIGWPTGNLFQKEVAFANLGFGAAGILCIWFHGLFWAATVVAASIFHLGAAATHIYDISKKGNMNIYNAGPVLWISGLFQPIATIALLIVYLLRINII